jgi:hypothetical protein
MFARSTFAGPTVNHYTNGIQAALSFDRDDEGNAALRDPEGNLVEIVAKRS